MKARFVFTGSFDIDFGAERSRVKKVFRNKKGKLKRQMHLIDLFQSGKLEEWNKAYRALPYDKDGEYPEQENVGMIFHDIMSGVSFNKFTATDFKIVYDNPTNKIR